MGALLSLRLLWGGLPWLVGPFRAVGREGLWAVSKVESSARAPHLPKIILLISFGDTLFVVSILNIVYDCHLRPLLQS